MAALATVADLALYLNTTIAAGTETNRANLALDIASANVRSLAGGSVSATASEVETIDIDDQEDVLILRHFPVTAVASVTIDGDTVDADEYRFSSAGLLTRLTGAGWGTGRIVVTYAYGYTAVPDDVKGIVLANAKRIYQGLEGVSAESLGSYSVDYHDELPTAGLTDDEKDILRGYRGLKVG